MEGCREIRTLESNDVRYQGEPEILMDLTVARTKERRDMQRDHSGSRGSPDEQYSGCTDASGFGGDVFGAEQIIVLHVGSAD